MKVLLSAVALLLLVSNATAQTVNRKALDRLLERARETNSDSVVVMKDGRPAAEWYSGGAPEKIELMSCTKSVVSLVIGRLIDDGRIKSLDQSVSDFYPEWRQGRKRLITIRHLLNHTSGLQNVASTSVEIYPSPDFVQLALAAELSHEPGTHFSYNNKAVNLLAGVVLKASGKRLDVYAGEAIFGPLGITDFGWTLDRAGNPHAMAGLQLKATDFAKFGQLVLNGGVWGGRRVVSGGWIEQSFAQSQPFEPTAGLLWWLVPAFTRYTVDDEKLKELEEAGVEAAVLKKLALMKGKTFDGRGEYVGALERVFGADLQHALTPFRERGVSPSRREVGGVEGYNANGTLGQYLVIYPKHNLVAVRQVAWKKSYDERTDSFGDFVELVKAVGE